MIIIIIEILKIMNNGMNSCVENKPKLIKMEKTELIKGILKLGEELDKNHGMGSVMIIDDMQRLIDNYVEQLLLYGVIHCCLG